MALGTMAKEQLETQLLLSKGGGIYYDAARVDADDSTATLFVGLGGTGADMLIRIKNEVKRRMKLPEVNGKIAGDTPANIGFLAFDTDKNAKEKTYGIATFDKYGSEFCSLSVDNLQDVVNQVKVLAKQGDPVWSWYDGLDPIAAVDGAGGIRQIGRLLLFQNVKLIYDRIEQKLDELRQANLGITRAMVILVAGIAGGTGSGTFIDMAFLIRRAIDKLNFTKNWVLGYAVLPDVNLLNGGERDQLWTNGYACLKEIDYWMSRGENEQNVAFQQNYGSGIDLINTKNRLLDFCHLLSSQDYDGKPMTYDKVISSMAETVFAYTAGETSAQSSGNSAMSSMYDNINAYIDGLDSTALTPACYRYLAIGSHKLEIPYEEISTLLAAELFKRLQPTLDLRPVQQTWERDLLSMSMNPKRLIHEILLDNVRPSPIQGNHNYDYSQIWGGQNTGPMSNRVYQDVYGWLAMAQAEITPIAANYDNVLNGRFLNFVRDNIKNPERGPNYLAYLLKSGTEWSIIPTLEKCAKFCNEVAASCVTRQSALQREMQTAYQAGHGKILMKQNSVNAYVSALGDWANNELSIFLYGERERVLRSLAVKLNEYYEKVFSKLSDVLEALPGIFQKNLEKIMRDQQEAIRDGKLDDTKLIWPQDFARNHRAEFERLLQDNIVSFLDALSANLRKWTGSDLENLDDGTGSSSTDVPGFISRFISNQFGSLLSIDMEDMFRAKLNGAEFDDYVRAEMLKLRERSVPMFNVRGQDKAQVATTAFALLSVPDDCVNIKAVANRYMNDDKTTIKNSKERTRLYYIKVMSHLPLFAYSRMEDAEKVYEQRLQNSSTAKGVHLVGTWCDFFPSPIPEATWTPNAYSNNRVKVYNERVRSAFELCCKNGIIVADDPDAPRKYILKIADAKRTVSLQTELSGSVDERISQMEELKNSLWESDSIELPSMGAVRSTLAANVCENTLRLPARCAKILEQAQILEKVRSIQEVIENPRVYFYGVLTGLIVKQGFRIVLKRSADSALFEQLFDTTIEKPFQDYEAYKEFCKLLNDSRRDEIEIIRRELITRIGDGSESDRASASDRTSAIIDKYPSLLTEIKSRIDRAAVDKRKELQDTQYFYQSVLDVANRYQNNYLIKL